MANTANNSSIVMRTDANRADWHAVKKRRRHTFGWLSVALFLISVVVMVYPVAINTFDYISYKEQLDELELLPEQYGEDELADALDKAYEYDERLSAGYSITPADYERVLAFNDDGIMGAVDFPTASLYLPIAHSATDGSGAPSTDTGVIHMGPGDGTAGSSLPVGGPSTHCVLIGTDETASSRLLDNISEVEVGDRVTLYAAGRALDFTVTEATITVGDRIPNFNIPQGEALLTVISSPNSSGERVLLNASYERGDKTGEEVYPRFSTVAPNSAITVIIGGFTILQAILFAIGAALFLFFALRFALFVTDLSPREIGRLKADSG